MLRLILLSIALLGAAAPALADDLEACRNRQADAKLRLDACERLITAGQLTGKDLGNAFAVRANALLLKRDNDKAIAAFTTALAADPDNVNYLLSRGVGYERKGDDDHAMADYNAVLQIRPSGPMALNNRGTLHLRKGELQSALDDFDAALKSNPNLYLAHFNRARVLTMNRDFDGALANLAEAQRIDPGAIQTAGYRCITFTAMGKFDEAIADCNSVIEKGPKNQFAIVSRANAYFGKGDLAAALKDYNLVLSHNPNNVRAYAGRGELFEKRGDLVQARADYRSASYALTPFDEIDTSVARSRARGRLAALTPQASQQGTARRVALIIGNGAYKNVVPLDNPPRDARLIADTLRAVGFQTVTLADNLTRNKFFDALHAFAREAEKADWAIVYYAGHGLEIGGVNYLLPVDAKLTVDRDALTEAVALEQVIAAVGGARKLKLVLLDACRDNPFEPSMQKTMALKLVGKGLSNIEPEAGFMVVYAAKHGETALDGETVNSPFATALAREIKEPKIEVRKLFDIVRDDVWTATKRAQQPFTYGSPPGREDFYFVAGK